MAIKSEMVTELIDGDFLVRQGDKPRYLYVVLSGSVDITAGPTAEARVYIDSRAEGDVIGEQAFIEGLDHSADVRARGRAQALKIPGPIVEKLLQHPKFARNLLTIESQKLRGSTRQRYQIIAENQHLFSHFRSHVDPQVVSSLIQQGENYGKPQYIEIGYVLFTDLRDFTRLSAALSEEDIAAQLAPYFSLVVDAVHGAYGIVDKYIGDAVMAVWGHPALGAIDANNIFDACCALAARAGDLTFGGETLRIGMGLNAGRLFMGNIGTEERRSFTVLGDAVNLASRYESANKAEDGAEFAITLGPAMFEQLDASRRARLVERPSTPIKGAPGNVQTVYSATVDRLTEGPL